MPELSKRGIGQVRRASLLKRGPWGLDGARLQGSQGSARQKERRLLGTEGRASLQHSPMGPQGDQFGRKGEFI